jgi:hypothetical protein
MAGRPLASKMVRDTEKLNSSWDVGDAYAKGGSRLIPFHKQDGFDLA